MTEDANILIVDDEIGILNLLEITLRKEYFSQITTVTTKAEALRLLSVKDFDIILLDVMLPDGEGFALCSEIRLNTSTPILFISARSSDFDKLTGLSVGGDDYKRSLLTRLKLSPEYGQFYVVNACMRPNQH